MGERKRLERAIRSVVRSLISRTGWIKAEQTWTYASASTFTVADHISGDRTVMFGTGAKLRLKQGGAYKYFGVVSASTSASVTTVTVTGYGTYTVADAAITDAFYSYGELPQGHPGTKGSVFIDGSADEIQLNIQGHSTQTSSTLVLEQSDGTDVLTVSNAGAVAGVDGSQTAPTFGFISDDNSGVFLAAANQVALTGGGVERMRLGGLGIFINLAGVNVDTVIAGENEANLFRVDAATDTVRMGDWDTNYMNVGATGITSWVGTGGMIHGEISAYDNATATTITGTLKANKVQVTIFDTNGSSLGMTPDHTSDDITVLTAGKYLCTVSAGIASSGVAKTIGASIYKNNGATEFANLHFHRAMAGGGGDIASTSMSGIIDLAVNDTIEMWVWNDTNTANIIVSDVTLTLMQIAGT